MCGRYVLTNTEKFITRFRVAETDLRLIPYYNIAPGQTMPIVLERGAVRHTLFMKWGLVPYWADDPRIGYKMINARREGINTKPSFQRPMRFQRCLVPASGFYEWKREETKKIPYYIRLKGREIFAFAGLYDIWKDAEHKELLTFTIITAPSNELVKEIHDRMPVIIEEENEEKWLNISVGPLDAEKLLTAHPAENMEAYPVSEKVNSPRNNSADLVSRIDSFRNHSLFTN